MWAERQANEGRIIEAAQTLRTAVKYCPASLSVVTSYAQLLTQALGRDAPSAAVAGYVCVGVGVGGGCSLSLPVSPFLSRSLALSLSLSLFLSLFLSLSLTHAHTNTRQNYGVTADPQFIGWKVRAGMDFALILASDGVWNALGNENVVEVCVCVCVCVCALPRLHYRLLTLCPGAY